MAKESKINLVVQIKIKIPLWDAIKMRIAGTHLGKYIDETLKSQLSESQLKEEIEEEQLG